MTGSSTRTAAGCQIELLVVHVFRGVSVLLSCHLHVHVHPVPSYCDAAWLPTDGIAYNIGLELWQGNAGDA